MPFVMHRHSDGTYRVHHRPVQGRDRDRMIDGPVFMRERKINGTLCRSLIYLQYGMGDGPWIIMQREYLTGKAGRLHGTATYAERELAEIELKALAAGHGWRDLGDHPGMPDFVD